MATLDRSSLHTLLAAATALVVAHALGRFAFTPLLPLLVDDGLLDLTSGARLATFNYLGYLLGALLALPLAHSRGLQIGLPAALLINASLTLLQTFVSDLNLLAALRLANGVSNGVVFVLAPALALEWLALRQATRHSGLVYLGLGAGMLLCTALVVLTPWTGALRWLPIGLCAMALALPCAHYLRRVARELHQHVSPAPQTALLTRRNTPLMLAYAGAGLGYILPMTFLPALARDQLAAGHPLITHAWSYTALACLISASVWNQIGAWLGDRRALLLNYLLQLIGATLPVVLPGALAIVACAVLVGGTFMGTVLLTQRLARALNPGQGLRLSALLISLYGGAQLVGPWAVEHWIEAGFTLSASFALGAAALLWALYWSWRIPAVKPTSPTGA